VADVFVSYSRRDSEYVRGLAGELTARGKEVWLDTQGLADGEVFPQALRSAIEGADAFVLVISPDSAASRYCATEVDHAAELGKRIVPVLLRPVGDAALPVAVRDRNWIPAASEDAVDRLVRAIDTDLEHVRAHTRWTARAVEWDQSGRDRSLLPRGSELSAGEAWLAGCATGADPTPTTLQRELLLAAQSASTRRQRLLLGVATGALIVSLALLVFALIARHTADTQRHLAETQRRTAQAQRTTAQAQALAARSAAALSLSPLAAIHLARQAVDVQTDNETLRALKQAEDGQTLIGAPASVDAPRSCDNLNPAYRPGTAELGLGSCDGTVHMVNARTGAPIGILHVGDRAARSASLPAAGAIAYRPDGRELAVLDGTEVRLVDPDSGRRRVVVRLPKTPVAANFASAVVYVGDGRKLAVINAGQRFMLIDDHTGQVRTVAMRSDGYGGLAAFPNGHRLVVATGQGPAEVFDAQTGRLVRRLPLPPHGVPTPVAVSPDGTQIAIGVAERLGGGHVELWSTRSWRRIAIRARDTQGSPESLTYASQGSQLVVGDNDGTVRAVSVREGDLSFSARLPGAVDSLAPDSGVHVTAIDSHGDVRIWRITGAVNRNSPPLPWVSDASQSGNLLQVVSARSAGGDGSVVHFYNRDGRQAKRPLTISKDGPRQDHMSDDGRLLIDFPFGTLGTATIWNVELRRPVSELPHLPINDAGWFGTRLLLLLGGSVTQGNFYFTAVRTYDPYTRRLGPSMSPDLTSQCGGASAHLSADGSRATVTTFCHDLYVYNARSGRLLRHTKGSQDDLAAALNANGHILADVYLNGEGDIRDSRTLRVRATLVGHSGYALPLGFAHDDDWLVTVGTDATMRVWRTSDGSLMRTITGPFDSGSLLADGRVALWRNASSSVVSVYDICHACGNAPELLSLAQPALRLPLTPIDRSLVSGQ
jgi:WD40 repeat protein